MQQSKSRYNGAKIKPKGCQSDPRELPTHPLRSRIANVRKYGSLAAVWRITFWFNINMSASVTLTKRGGTFKNVLKKEL